MRQKLSLLLLMALFAVGGVNATEYDLSLSSLSGKTYNSSTYECNFGTTWDENQWWIGDTSPLDISSYGEFVVEYSGATAAAKYRVYLEPTSGTTQTVYPTASTTIGRNVFKLASGLNNIKKIVISGAGNELSMKLTRVYFRSKSNASATDISTTSTALGDWGSVTLNWDNKGSLSNAKIGDVIRVTFTSALSGNQINIQDASYSTFMDGTFENFTVQDDAQTLEYVIPNATIAESIYLNGIVISGKKATITKVELVTYTESYEAMAVTIGSDEVATYSTSNKSLDFNGTGITPYYASAVASGEVTLTSVRYLRGYQGYIVKGTAGTYEVPVVSTEEEYPSTNYLKPIGDYSAVVAASTEGTYHYIFAKHSSTIGFYKLASSAHTLEAHKAYLETENDITPAAGARGITLNFDDGTTAILPIFQDGNSSIAGTEDNACYTLQGIRVQNPTKGLYIQNGKKFMVK